MIDHESTILRRGRQACNDPRVPSRAPSDEAYVVDLLDEIIGVPARRGHRFDWLVGDPGKSGRAVRLPVDAYWEHLKLVVEYREDQHFKPNAFMDRRQTISGMGRGEQRKLYDQRRDELIPANGLSLLVITPHQLRVRRRDRLARDRAHDTTVLRGLLEHLL
jgi:hypothetical protein